MSIRELIQAIKRRDPAIKSRFEVWLYPGLWVMIFHKPAHRLYRAKWYFLARLISQMARGLTGIEIHPGAKIGQGVLIDHGAGVVIGETCEIGDNVLIYHGVTLGAVSAMQGRRHPLIENDAIIGAGALVLGPVTVGAGAKIGAGAIILKDVPPGATMLSQPARVYTKKTDNAELETAAKVREVLNAAAPFLPNKLRDSKKAELKIRVDALAEKIRDL